MNARSVPCPYCKAGKGQECRAMRGPAVRVHDHAVRVAAAGGKRQRAKPPTQWNPSPTPWRVSQTIGRIGASIKIIDANGVTIATMQGAGREANANLLVRTVNVAQA